MAGEKVKEIKQEAISIVTQKCVRHDTFESFFLKVLHNANFFLKLNGSLLKDSKQNYRQITLNLNYISENSKRLSCTKNFLRHDSNSFIGSHLVFF